MAVLIGERPLTVDDVVAVARSDAKVEIVDAARARMARTRRIIDDPCCLMSISPGR